jgi:hypothetical protein
MVNGLQLVKKQDAQLAHVLRVTLRVPTRSWRAAAL